MSLKNQSDGVLKVEDCKKLDNKKVSKKPKEKSPNQWLKQKYPKVYEKHGEPLNIGKTAQAHFVKEIDDDFFAALLGDLGHPDAPTVRLTGRFYTYKKDSGIYEEVSDGAIEARISCILKQCARECASKKMKTNELSFRLSNSARLGGVIKRAKALLEKPEDFFDHNNDPSYVVCCNGMLRISDRKLEKFSPKHQVRNKLAVNYDPEAQCPLFEHKLLGEALDPDQIDLAQRWCGLALLGYNISQKIVLLIGKAGTGKSTLMNIITAVIGDENIATLRPDQLNTRFEMTSFLGKTLLHGVDVSVNFLASKNSTYLKALTGGEVQSVELKNVNKRVKIEGNYNVAITSNGKLTLHLENDVDAWLRRLVIISYNKQVPVEPDQLLEKKILKQEFSGVLNWMLDGLDRLIASNYLLTLTESQHKEVEDLLMASQAPEIFVRECLVLDENSIITKAQVAKGFHEFCKVHNWPKRGLKDYITRIEREIDVCHGLRLRKDIKISAAEVDRSDDFDQTKTPRLWKGLRLKSPDNPDSKS